MSGHQTVTIRTRSVGWFSAGIAVALAATGVLLGVRADAAPGADETTFVPITPCRLFDTRPAPDTIGPRNTPIGANETHTQQVTGTNGNCTIPPDASGVAMNVTAVGPTAPSFLQLWPSDEAQPAQGSSLNYLPGQAPTPNKVDVKLGATGAVKIYNLAGSVNVLADVVGYYTGTGLQELVADVAAKANAADVYTKAEVNALLAPINARLTAIESNAPLYAHVEGTPTPSITRGSGAVSVTYQSLGDFTVIFDRDISTCAYAGVTGEAVSGTPADGTTINISSLSGNANGVWVEVFDAAGAEVDEDFYVVVIC